MNEKNISKLDETNIPEEILELMLEVGHNNGQENISRNIQGYFVESIKITDHERKDRLGLNIVFSGYVIIDGITFDFKIKSGDSSGIEIVYFEVDETSLPIKKHKCNCEIMTIMRSGCKCGGI